MIITIEGTDGSGKNTQAKLLTEFLSNYFNTKMFSFPNYEETFFGKEVGKYLDGDYGNLKNIDPRFASLLFALDRFEHVETIKDLVYSENILVMDRYVNSNIIYQCSRLPIEKRAEMREWLEKVEYNILGVPVSDINIFLDLPPKQSRKLVLNKEVRCYTDKKEDLHEQSENLITDSYNYFKNVAKVDEWVIVDCINEQGEIKTVEEIHKNLVNKLLNTDYGRWRIIKNDIQLQKTLQYLF